MTTFARACPSSTVDLGDMRIGNADIDLSAAIWSLKHNLSPGYGLLFLQQYGVKDASDDLAEHLRACNKTSDGPYPAVSASYPPRPQRQSA